MREYARGIAGGFLFSLPLLYTMEVWWAGFIAGPLRLLAGMAAGLLVLFGYNRHLGLRSDASWLEVAVEAVEEMGLGLAIAAGSLWLLGRIEPGRPLSETVGTIVVEGVVVAIGVSVGTAQLGGNGGDGEGGGGDEDRGMAGREEGEVDQGSELVLAACGAVLLAANVAPTEEVVVIAIEASSWQLLGLVATSLALGALILFYSDFKGAGGEAHVTAWTEVVADVVAAYAVALAASAFILWFFGRFVGTAPAVAVAEVVVLGVPAMLGAAAGRLLLR